jgi:hypothetical protein
MLLLFAIACRPAPDPLPSPARFRTPGPAIGVELALGHGAPGQVWVRAVAADGTTVPGEDVAVQLGARTEQASLAVDGYSRHRLAEVGSHLVEAGGASGRVFVREPAAIGRGLRPAVGREGAADRDLETVGAGVVGLADGVVWWLGSAGPWHVLLAPDEVVRGVRGGHLDADGIRDAVAWTDTTVWLLRGRPAGGAVAVGSWTGGERVAGAALGDADGDGLADVVIAWADAAGGQLDVWLGDGDLGFRSSPNRRLQGTPTGVAVGRDEDDADPVVSVVAESRAWERFAPFNGSWARVGPNLAIDLPPGGAWITRDLLDEGGHELLVARPVPADGAREIQLIDLSQEVRRLTLDRPGWLTIADVDANGIDDLLFAAPDGRVAWSRSREPGALSTSSLLDVPAGGPIGRFPEGRVLVTSDSGWWTFGLEGDVEAQTPVARRLESWGPVPAGGRFAVLEDAVALVPEGADTLQLWRETEGVRLPVGSVSLGAAGAVVPDALVACGPTVWVATAAELVAIDASDPASPTVLSRTPLAASHLVCAGETVWARVGDEVRQVDRGGVEGSVVTMPGGPLAVLDGQPVTCAEEGCGVAVGPFGPGGRHVVVSSSATGVTVGDVAVGGRGAPTVADVDGDGRPDLVLHDAGVLTLHRHTAFGFAPTERWWSEDRGVGAVQIADRDGDGHVDLWRLGANGRIRVTPLPDPGPTGPADTADTGR